MNHSAPAKPASFPHRTSNVASKLPLRLAAQIGAKIATNINQATGETQIGAQKNSTIDYNNAKLILQ